MNKIMKVLLIMITILILLMITVPRYVDRKVDISLKVGEPWHGGNVSVMEYNVISRYFHYFFNLVEEQDYEHAYAMTTLQYRLHDSLEDFIKKLESYPIDSFILKEVLPLSQNLFQVKYINNEVEYSFLTLLSEGKMEIVLGDFLEEKQYDDVNKTKSKVKYHLKKTENYTNQFLVYLEVDNKRDTDIFLQDLTLQVEGHRLKEAIQERYIVPKKQLKEVVLEFEMNFEFPAQIQFDTVDEKGRHLGTVSFEI